MNCIFEDGWKTVLTLDRRVAPSGGLAEVARRDWEVAATLGGTEQRSIAQFCYLTLDNWTLLLN